MPGQGQKQNTLEQWIERVLVPILVDQYLRQARTDLQSDNIDISENPLEDSWGKLQ